MYFGADVPNWPPFCFIDNDRAVGIPSEFLSATDFENHRASKQGPALADWGLEAVVPTLRGRAVPFITESSRSEKPFFLSMPLTSPRTPLAVNERWTGKSGLDNACADLIMATDAVVGNGLPSTRASGRPREDVRGDPRHGAGGLSKGSDALQATQLDDLAPDIGEQNNLAEAQPDRIVAMQQLLEQLITDGRSTPGAPQKNDVNVIRSPRP